MVLQKEEVLKSFQALQTEYERNKLRVATKDELAAKAKHKQIVETVSAYTADNILKGLTDLQLNFSDTIGKWTLTLQNESKKQEELQKAIEIEQHKLKNFRSIRAAAGALYLLKQENEAKTETLTKMHNERLANFEEFKGKEKTSRLTEQVNFEQILVEFGKKQERERKSEAEEYAYNAEKQQKLDKDKYEETKKMAERELVEEEEKKKRNWIEREQILDKNKAEYEQNRKKLDEFPAKLEEEIKKEREDAAKEAAREARVKSDLAEKEEAANKQIAEQRISTLEKVVGNNDSELAKLTEQLNDALKKVQDLSLRALENNNK
jgi:hypothetical protein